MSYRIYATAIDRDTGEHIISHQIFGNNEFPESFRAWLREKDIAIDENDMFGLRWEKQPGGGEELIDIPIEVDPSELLRAIAIADLETYMAEKTCNHDPFKWIRASYERDGDSAVFPPEVRLLDAVLESPVTSALSFFVWGTQLGIFRGVVGIDGVPVAPERNEQITIGISGN